MPNELTGKEVVEIAQRYCQGQSIAGIAAAMGRSVSAVRASLKEGDLEVDRSRKYVRYTDEQVDQVVDLYVNGQLGAAQIARIVGLSDGTVVYSLLKRRGVTARTPGRGRTAPAGATHVGADGYVAEKVEPTWPYLREMRGKGSNGLWQAQHRKVMAEHLGRPLLPTEQVHHINGVRSDNRLENLQLISQGHVAGAALRCCDCGSTNVEAVPLAGKAQS